MTLIEPQVKNVKVSFHQNVSECLLHLIKHAYKYTNSYLIVKDKYTFTIYHKSNIVNITGIPTFEEISTAVEQFAILSTLPYDPTLIIKIDNTTVSGKFPFKINFSLLSQCGCVVRYTPLFPGAFVTLPNNIKTILFKSGKYVIVGCKSKEHVHASFRSLSEIVKEKLQ